MTEEQSYRYGGLRHVFNPAISVAEAAQRLRRFAYIEERMMRLFASRIVTIRERDIKVLLARLQYEEAMHADAWRERLAELRVNKHKLEQVPDEALAVLFDEAEYLPGSYPFLLAMQQVLKSALVEAYRTYLVTTNGLADYPSVRILQHVLAEEDEHLRLLALTLDSLQPSEEEERLAASWQTTLRRYLEAAGGMDGSAPRSKPIARLHSANQTYHLPHELMRDETLPRVWDYVVPSPQETQAYLNYMMGLRLSEINVAEGLAIVLFETSGMPWSFYRDISRHCWDEMRHSLFGEAAIESTYGRRDALPIRDYEGVFVMEASPLEQYAVLGLEVEGGNMKYPPGKRYEWEFARDEARHALMTTFQDFDWADEVLHVNIARRQLDTWFEGGLKAIRPFAKRGREHRTQVKQRHEPVALPQPEPVS
jgi:hypothetical protein